jgi:hypothetical protein
MRNGVGFQNLANEGFEELYTDSLVWRALRCVKLFSDMHKQV